VVKRCRERAEEFAEALCIEAGKPICDARGEVGRLVDTFRIAAGESVRIHGQVLPLDIAPRARNYTGMWKRVPIGPCAFISPFNFPLNLVAHKIAPAIAAGCPVVLKPASQTPISAITLAELLLDECGLPPGHLNVVTGSGGSVGNAIVEHDDIAMITFTGSPEVGWGIRARVPEKKVGLELGNNAPVIIEADGDWRTAAAKIKVAGFSHAGQSCISTQRMFVHMSIYQDFLQRLVARRNALHVLNAPSPGATASLAIGGEIADKVAPALD
jgi:acyl-CoA reductase-like NAD-dependent aldehyde dehydrogenase